MYPTEKTIKTEEIQIERKRFLFELRENARGRFLRITEEAGRNRDVIIIPTPGLDDFRRCLVAMEAAGVSV